MNKPVLMFGVLFVVGGVVLAAWNQFKNSPDHKSFCPSLDKLFLKYSAQKSETKKAQTKKMANFQPAEVPQQQQQEWDDAQLDEDRRITIYHADGNKNFRQVINFLNSKNRAKQNFSNYLPVTDIMARQLHATWQ